MTLRKYQTSAVERTYAEWHSGARRVVLVMPTGAGKTRTGAEIVRAAVAKGRRAVWLAHRIELVGQAVAALRAAGLRVGAISASSGDVDADAPVQVATVQTLLARGVRPEATLVVFDECHHAVADEFASVLTAYPCAFVLGLTATPERGDGRGLDELFERMIVGIGIRALVDAGHLVHAEIVRPARQMRAGEIAALPVDAYKKYGVGRRAISFTSSIQAAVDHAVQFSDAGYTTDALTGDTAPVRRTRIVDGFRAGTIQVLNNVFVCTEGFDVPEVSCVIMARGCGTLGTWLQIVGRGLRPAPGKTDCLILDLHGVSHVHGHPEDDIVYSLKGRGMRRSEADANRYCAVCGAILREPPCLECGATTEPVGAPKVIRTPLEKYAAKRRETPAERAETLRRWRAEASARGWNPKQAVAKYRAVYGTWPDREVESLAR